MLHTPLSEQHIRIILRNVISCVDFNYILYTSVLYNKDKFFNTLKSWCLYKYRNKPGFAIFFDRSLERSASKGELIICGQSPHLNAGYYPSFLY